ncbi:hypothetical protein [Rhizosphaericola mali]|uniref:M1 family metallopeptidase n=1 Tax=Rhizosphaericola mali TaxID=2545455 RepID=A0A5P2G0A7_9BACT|nr:hypothetical protein [Rhizosphaericola mali]QES89224.1 M1 family metallopeptidase [Rhizosphaericola mali]
MKKIFLIILSFFAFHICQAQQKNDSSENAVYSPYEAFAPLFYPMYGDKIRAADGTPGPEYWQNTADYKIACTLSDSLDHLTSDVTVDYTNNSPQNLSFVWMQLDQNVFKENATGVLASANPTNKRFNVVDWGGYTIKDVKIKLNGKIQNADYSIFDT